MSNSTPLKKQNFLFIREKLETKLKQFKNAVLLDSARYNRNVTTTTLQHALRNNLVVSHSGRTLADILSLSYPENLSVYTVDNVVPGFGKEGTVVCYSRPESEIAELRGEFNKQQAKLERQQAKLERQEAKLEGLQAEVDELKKRIGGNSEVLAEWQTASLVMCAFGSFAWNLVSLSDKTELNQYNIHKFWDLYYAHLKAGTIKKLAQRIYRKIDEKVRIHAVNLKEMKADVTESRRKLAHPDIPDDSLVKFLCELRSDADLEPIEVEMFNYLKSRSSHPQNIELAARGGVMT